MVYYVIAWYDYALGCCLEWYGMGERVNMDWNDVIFVWYYMVCIGI